MVFFWRKETEDRGRRQAQICLENENMLTIPSFRTPDSNDMLLYGTNPQHLFYQSSSMTDLLLTTFTIKPLTCTPLTLPPRVSSSGSCHHHPKATFSVNLYLSLDFLPLKFSCPACILHRDMWGWHSVTS